MDSIEKLKELDEQIREQERLLLIKNREIKLKTLKRENRENPIKSLLKEIIRLLK